MRSGNGRWKKNLSPRSPRPPWYSKLGTPCREASASATRFGKPSAGGLSALDTTTLKTMGGEGGRSDPFQEGSEFFPSTLVGMLFFGDNGHHRPHGIISAQPFEDLKHQTGATVYSCRYCTNRAPLRSGILVLRVPQRVMRGRGRWATARLAEYEDSLSFLRFSRKSWPPET